MARWIEDNSRDGLGSVVSKLFHQVTDQAEQAGTRIVQGVTDRAVDRATSQALPEADKQVNKVLLTVAGLAVLGIGAWALTRGKK